MSIYVEDWAMSYGSPYLVKSDDPGNASVELVEDGDELRTHAPSEWANVDRLAFVDGVRRGEASLYQSTTDARVARGVTGAVACGAVTSDVQNGVLFAETRVHRFVIWGAGLTAALPTVAGGWAWRSVSIASDGVDAPLNELQTRMRQEEGRLAEGMCNRGYFVIADGPLNFALRRDLEIVGYIKTHHRALLPPDKHFRIPMLGAGQRTSLFRLGDDRYSTYLRLTPGSGIAGPWSGIVRLEFPATRGLEVVSQWADGLAMRLPKFAGIAHRDPRAPQNLQPIGALESHLRHLLGDGRLAERAVREAIHTLNTTSTETQGVL